MVQTVLVGVVEVGVVHSDAKQLGLDDRFRMVKESGVCDYPDVTPPPNEATAALDTRFGAITSQRGRNPR